MKKIKKEGFLGGKNFLSQNLIYFCGLTHHHAVASAINSVMMVCYIPYGKNQIFGAVYVN